MASAATAKMEAQLKVKNVSIGDIRLPKFVSISLLESITFLSVLPRVSYLVAQIGIIKFIKVVLKAGNPKQIDVAKIFGVGVRVFLSWGTGIYGGGVLVFLYSILP